MGTSIIMGFFCIVGIARNAQPCLRFSHADYHHTGKRRNALDCSDRCPADFPKNSKNRHRHGRSAAPHSSCHKPDSKTLDCSPQTLCNLPVDFYDHPGAVRIFIPFRTYILLFCGGDSTVVPLLEAGAACHCFGECHRLFQTIPVLPLSHRCVHRRIGWRRRSSTSGAAV